MTKKAGETLGTYRYEEDEDEEEYPDEQYFSKFYLEQNPDALEEWIDKQVPCFAFLFRLHVV